MPAEDPIDPEQNSWLYKDADGRWHEAPSALAAQEEERIRSSRKAEQAGKLQALAASLGVDAEWLAERVPEDTLRRLKYPVVEQPQSDGTTAFKHDLGISTEVRPFLGTDRAYGDIPKDKRRSKP